MLGDWIQFGLLLLAFLAFALRNEHRITKLEGHYELDHMIHADLERRMTQLERRKN